MIYINNFSISFSFFFTIKTKSLPDFEFLYFLNIIYNYWKFYIFDIINVYIYDIFRNLNVLTHLAKPMILPAIK